jgi:3-hydroxy-3-methylglutaryl CoA synthase
VQRYLDQMLGELNDQTDPDDPSRSLLDSIDLIVPHQANKTMIVGLAEKAGLSLDQLYFNIGTMGNVSAASIPIALADAVRDGVIDRPLRVFAPGFGAGAVGGYAVLRVDPAIIAPGLEPAADEPAPQPAGMATTSDDVRVAFGE